MKANETTMKKYLEGSKQFMVPLFQRTYSWKRDNIRKLWEDIEETRGGKGVSSHFFGSFVTVPVPSPASGVSKYTIIDGQQRLTTICILLAALRNRILAVRPDYENRDEINESYLFNKFHPEAKHKVVPTQADRDVFFTILREPNPPVDNDHLITQAYKYFRDKLFAKELDNLEVLVSLQNTLLLNFSIVDIQIEDKDNPYVIFETLNWRGTPLTQADLIRNYLFMNIRETKQQEVYERTWLPMQQRLNDHLESYIRHYLAMGGSIPNFEKIYATFTDMAEAKTKDRAAKEEKEAATTDRMKDLAKFSNYYIKFLNPQNEPEQRLKRYFHKLSRLEVTTSYPLLLKLYDDCASGKLSLDDFSECLRCIETYIVRRAVCGIPTNVLNKYFPTIYNSLDQDSMANSLRNKLKGGVGSRSMPVNEEFKQCLKQRKLFGNKILRYVLEEMERQINKEAPPLEKLQVEHIMPQKLSDEWKNELGSEWELVHQKYSDTLGNVTLTGYNPEYSNKLFVEKRDMEKGFKDSGLQMNRNLAKLERWTEREIVDRAEQLSEIALRIWST